MIKLSPKAAEQVKKIIAQESNESQDDLRLRIGVQGGGCSGLSYFMTLDKEARTDDHAFEEHGVKLLMDSKSALYLEGTEIDYLDGLQGSGFTFHNPNAVRSCGCGSSFQA